MLVVEARFYDDIATALLEGATGALKSAGNLEQARARLVKYGAAKDGVDDLTKMMRVLRSREALAQFGQGLPARIDKLDGTRYLFVKGGDLHARFVPLLPMDGRVSMRRKNMCSQL